MIGEDEAAGWHLFGSSPRFLRRLLSSLSVSSFNHGGGTALVFLFVRVHMPSFVSFRRYTDIIFCPEFAPQAVTLFNNMKTPASIIAGAMVPLGLLAPVPIYNPDGGKNENCVETIMRRSYTSVSVLALLSEFISVVFATVAVNQLTETAVEPASSVW